MFNRKKFSVFKPQGFWPTNKYRLYLSLGLLISPVLFTFVSAINFLSTPELEFSYASRDNCINRHAVLPSTSQQNPDFNVYHTQALSIAGLTLYSNRTCIEPVSPLPQSVAVPGTKMLGFLPSQIKVNHVPPSPLEESSQTNISPDEKLTFKLNQADVFSDYYLVKGSDKTICQTSSNLVTCPLKQLDIGYGESHQLRLNAVLNNKARTISEANITTPDKLLLTSSSIDEGSTINFNPDNIKLAFNKPIASIENVSLVNGKSLKEIATESSFNEQTITISLKQNLVGQSNYQLNIKEVKANDGAETKDLVLNFNTSGSPRVTSTNLKEYGNSVSANLVLNFDSNLHPDQALGKLISLKSGSNLVPANITSYNNRVTIDPTQPLASCNQYQLVVATGLVSQAGFVDQTTNYSHSFKTSCATIFSIGTSVQGRAITAYKFGNGPKQIVYYGAIHGNEISGKYLLESFIQDLEQSYVSLPNDVTVYIVPSASPDSVTNGSRYNANGVDLNRNFDTHDWKKDVTVPGGELRLNGGGTAPLSEPESKAIANFSAGKDLVVYYHAVATTVIANGTSSSYGYAQKYASLSGYPDKSGVDSGEIFNYDIVGTYGDYTRDKLGVDAVLVELSTMAGNEYSRHKNAIWAMLE